MAAPTIFNDTVKRGDTAVYQIAGINKAIVTSDCAASRPEIAGGGSGGADAQRSFFNFDVHAVASGAGHHDGSRAPHPQG